MTQVLVIKAHLFDAPHSRTMTMLKIFLDVYKRLHPTDHFLMVDIYKHPIPEIDQDLLKAWEHQRHQLALSKKQAAKMEAFNHSTDTFLAAGKVIIANPIWCSNIPARLQNWIDSITVARKTFHYTNHGVEPLSVGKKWFIFKPVEAFTMVKILEVNIFIS